MRRLLACAALALALPALVHAADNPVVAATKRTATASSTTFHIAISTHMGGQRSTMTGTGAQKGMEAKLSLRMRAQGATFGFDTVLVREGGSYVMYVRSPLFRAQLPPGKSWIRVDVSQQGAALGLDFSSLVNASQSYAPLEKGLVSTTRTGGEVVAGVPATRYRAVIDVKRAARALPAYGKQIAALERATGMRLGRATYDVWVGSDRRLRRVRYSMPTGTGTAGGTAVSTITFLSFDRPVRIAVPPRSQVATAP